MPANYFPVSFQFQKFMSKGKDTSLLGDSHKVKVNGRVFVDGCLRTVREIFQLISSMVTDECTL